MNTKDERDICKAELHIEINESKNRVKKVLDYSQDVPLITKILNDDLLKITHKFIFFALADSDEDFGDRNSLQKKLEELENKNRILLNKYVELKNILEIN